MIRLSDYVINFLVKERINDLFLVSGGGIMYLLDSLGKNKKINYIANHHEQATAIAAEAYARTRNHIAACLVTTGPGGTNAITGVAGAWVDSIPMIVISGQVKRQIIADYSKMRQMGPQEINIVPMVKPITKYAKTIMSPDAIRYELEKAFYIATSGRPGPVWIDIPLDVQSSMVDEAKLKSYSPPKKDNKKDNLKLKKAVFETIKLLKKFKRPVMICGHGIRLSGGEKVFKKLVNIIKIPLLTDHNGLNLVSDDNPLFMGRYGPGGQRRANFTLQNADLILSIGSSLNVASTGFDFKGFAPRAKKIMVNIDKGELTKSTIAIDFPVQADVKEFMEELINQLKNVKFKFSSKWFEVCNNWKKRYPTITNNFYEDEAHVNSYIFFDLLSDCLSKEDVLVTGVGLDVVSLFQAFKLKEGQRVFVNKNFGQMGWCLPAAIGACVANNCKKTICVTGDGSIQMNIQELETIKYYKLPIKIFVFNNKGYKSIRDTQNSLFNGHLVGADDNSGVSNPSFKLLAAAHDLEYAYISNNKEIKSKVIKALSSNAPTLFEVNIAYNQLRMPRATTYKNKDGKLESKPLEDMFPFLPKEEIWENMHYFDEE